MPVDEPKTNFSDDRALNNWFRENVWLANPRQWDRNRIARVEAESFHVRRELDRRSLAVRDSKADSAIFWSGIVMSIAGVALLAVPPAAALAAVGAPLAYVGLGASAVGGAVRHVNNETSAQLAQRSEDLNNFQRALSDMKRS